MNIADCIKNKLQQLPNWLNIILLKLNVLGPYAYGAQYVRNQKRLLSGSPEKRLLRMVNYAIKHVPYYREKYGNVTVNNLQDFEEKIDFINKDEVMKQWDKFISDEIDLKRCFIGTTGGTSGKPLKLAFLKNRYAVELVFMHNMWKRTGWNYSVRAVLRNHKLPDSKIYTINPMTKEVIFDAFRISTEYVKEIVPVLKRFRIEYFHAYPSAAFQFCKICQHENIDISFIKCFLCGSEAVTDEQYQFITKRLGINIFSWYGHSEKLILGGYKDEYPLIYIEPQYGWFELINKNGNKITQSNEKGEMVGSTFYNYVMPLIRYKTGDWATLEQERGKIENYAVIKNIVGRWDKNLIYRNDGTTTTITALNLHNDLYDKIDGMQFIQEKIGELIVTIIKGKDYDESTESYLYNHFRKAMGKDAKVIIKYVQHLYILPNGKFLSLINKIEHSKWNN